MVRVFFISILGNLQIFVVTKHIWIIIGVITEVFEYDTSFPMISRLRQDCRRDKTGQTSVQERREPMQDPLPPNRCDIAQSLPFRIAVMYALFGALWILLSDKVLDLMDLDRASITLISMNKGWLFVGVTSWLLYRLIRRDYRKLQDAGALLQESEQRYRLIFEHSLDGILLTVPDGRILAANPAACRILEGTEEEICQIGRQGLVALNDSALPIVLDERYCDGSAKGVLAFTHKDSATVFCEISSVHYKDREGRDRTNLFIRDISERRRSEQVLRESEARYRTLFDETPAVILVIDTETAEIVTANSAAASFYGYPREELIGMKTTDINILPKEQTFKNLEEAQKGPQHVERRHRLKSGEVRDVEVYRGPLSIENRSYLFALVHDITDRKKIEGQLRDNENKLRAITDAVADSIILIDDDMRVTYWNGAAEKMFGRSRAEVMGEKIDFIVPDRFRDAHLNGYHRFIASQESTLSRKVHEVSAMGKDGIEFPVELSLAGVRLMGKWHTAGIIRDISERKNLEGQLRHAQKMEAIGTLTGGIAHDFNNALTAIIGFGSLVRMNIAVDSRLISYIDNILTAADRAADLTRSLLTFSSNKPIEAKKIDLNEVIARAEKLLTRLLRDDISFMVERSGEPVVIMADPGQIVQLMMNLAVNAEAAMPQGGRVIISLSHKMLEAEFVRIHGYGNPGRYGLITFTDNGCGMDEETRVRIFEPFFTTKGVGKGTGLGLSTVYGIIKQHRGYINCYSEPGRGTTFRIYLPIMDSDLATEPIRPAVRGGTETILLAEDNMLVRGLISDLLGQSGYRVIEAVDGEDAVAKFREEADSIQLLVLDVIMPKKNGRQVYEEIRAIKPDMKVIFTSGYPAETFKGAEFDDPDISFVSKPVTPSDLLGKMREMLEG